MHQPLAGLSHLHSHSLTRCIYTHTHTIITTTMPGLLDLGYTVIEVDDCWAEYNRNASGFMVANASRFPSGMKALGDFIHSLGGKFGVVIPNAHTPHNRDPP